MKIEEKIEKYLVSEGFNKVSKKEALDKVIKTIKSSKTEKQLDTAAKMVINFYDMYGKGFMNLDLGSAYADWKRYGIKQGILKKLFDKIDDQRERIKHLDKNK